ncbi:MAG TPA: YjjG family noncanonical pyrimidine nucleotidase [Bacteroidia bacterium]|nr:YjjG family noncanonical pyrimidine nucleotidase [Bacteroidia bacterium]
MKTYLHIFFDLDDTLWDFKRNSAESLHELYSHFNLKNVGVDSPEYFIRVYQERNMMMWEQYRLGAIDKETLRSKRFELTFWDMGIDAALVPKQMPEYYLSVLAAKHYLYPHAIEILEYLKEKYFLHIITNGFAEVQYIKLNSSRINRFFRHLIISDEIGVKKPDIKIFHHALDKAGAKAEESIMIGDGLDVDIAGARNAGMDQVFFNPENLEHNHEVTYEIKSLSELKNFL